MPIPIAPIAGIAARYGLVAISAYVIARRAQPAPFDQRGEDAMNDVNEGLGLRRGVNQLNANAKLCRTVRLGNNGAGLQFELTSLNRLKIRKV